MDGCLVVKAPDGEFVAVDIVVYSVVVEILYCLAVESLDIGTSRQGVETLHMSL